MTWVARHIYWIIGVALVALIAAALVVPYVIDWLAVIGDLTPRQLSRVFRVAEKLSHFIADALLFSWIFALGASLASFLNVVAYRLPRQQSILGRSRCPNCWRQLGPTQNIPVLGWVHSLGRCRFCHLRISPRYLIAELVLGFAFVALYAVDIRYDFPTRALLVDWSANGAAGLGPRLTEWLTQVILVCLVFTAMLIRVDAPRIPGSFWIAALSFVVPVLVLRWWLNLPDQDGWQTGGWLDVFAGLIAGGLVGLVLFRERRLEHSSPRLLSEPIWVFLLAGAVIGPLAVLQLGGLVGSALLVQYFIAGRQSPIDTWRTMAVLFTAILGCLILIPPLQLPRATENIWPMVALMIINVSFIAPHFWLVRRRPMNT